MVPDAGHYPQSQQPQITTKAVLSFLKRLPVMRNQQFENVSVTSTFERCA